MSRLFDGVDDQTLGTISTVSDSDWTMASWVYPATAGESNQGWIMAALQSGGVRQMFRMAAAGRTIYASQEYATTTAASTSVETLSASAWSLVVATHRASDNTMRLHIGTLSAAVAECTYSTQTAGVGAFTTGGGQIRLGCRNATDRTFDGRIGPSCFDIREWTVPEMERFRSGLFPIPTSTMRCLYPLMSPDAAQGEDLSGNATALTVTGCTAAENPPVAFRWGDDLGLTFTATAGGASAVPVMMANYRRRRVA